MLGTALAVVWVGRGPGSGGTAGCSVPGRALLGESREAPLSLGRCLLSSHKALGEVPLQTDIGNNAHLEG